MPGNSPRGTVARGTWARGLFPHQLSWLIDNPLRRLLVSPHELANRLSLTESGHILEVGPGSGYFSAELAGRVPRGRLELFDLQAKMLTKARRKLSSRGLLNVSYTQGDASGRLPFRDEHFDLALLACVLGEISNKETCLRSLYRVLRSGRVLAFHESFLDPDRIEFKELLRLVEAQGFAFRQRWGHSWSYTATFEKQRSHTMVGAV